MQRNWIGKSRGLQMAFKLAEPVDGFRNVEVYRHGPIPLHGASFMAIAAEHPLAKKLAKVTRR